MTRRPTARALLAFAALLLLSSAAQAQIFRAYLDPAGNDANPCTLQAPCRLLPAALAAVASGGEIWMLDSANYNTSPVSINKSVTILAVPGALGSVVAIGGNAIDISTIGVKVALRNLVIVSFPGGTGNGINMTNGASLSVVGCVISGLPAAGIFVNTPAIVRIVDSTIRDNGTFGLWVLNGARATVTRSTITANADTGVWAISNNAATTTTADITDSTIGGSNFGVTAASNSATGVVRVSIRGSAIVRNLSYGAVAQSTAGGPVTLSSSGNTVSNNGNGLAVIGTGANLWATGNTVSGNATGLVQSVGTLTTPGDNAVRNNGTNLSGAITGVPKL